MSSALLKRAKKFTESYERELGGTISILPGTDPADTVQDDYGAIIRRSDQNSRTVKAYPIRFQPTVKQLEESGIGPMVDATFRVTHGELKRAGLIDSNDALLIDPTRGAIIHKGVQYLIAMPGRPHTINDTSYAYVFGCMRK